METWLVPIAVAVVTGFFAFVAAARKLSGSIRTSEATSLWQEAANLRKEYKDEVSALRQQLGECLVRIKNVEDLNSKLKVENGGLTRTVEDQAQRITELESVIVVLEGDNRRLKARVLELENALRGLD